MRKMVSRRSLLTTAAGGLLAHGATQIPAHACDCHTHIFGDPRQFPFSPHRRYTPRPALPEEMAALHRELHMERVVIVTPSVYGTDNSATLYGLKARGPSARGVAVIDDKTSNRELDAMAKAGIRGIRLNLATAGIDNSATSRQLFHAAATRMAERGWHIQMFTSLGVIAAIKDLVLASPVPVVFDHFGGAEAARGLHQPGFADLLELLKSGKAYAKLSGAYRVSQWAPDYPDAAPLARALIAANRDRIVWGTDWPHPDSAPPSGNAMVATPFLQIGDARLLQELIQWSGDEVTLRKILVENPARLYKF